MFITILSWVDACVTHRLGRAAPLPPLTSGVLVPPGGLEHGGSKTPHVTHKIIEGSVELTDPISLEPLHRPSLGSESTLSGHGFFRPQPRHARAKILRHNPLATPDAVVKNAATSSDLQAHKRSPSLPYTACKCGRFAARLSGLKLGGPGFF